MATGAGPPLASRELGEEDLAVVIEALVPVAKELEFFGLQIGVQMNEIALIKKELTNPRLCLLKILHTRLERSPALTWNDIDRALRSKSVGMIQLANSINEKYGRLFSHDPSFEASLGQEESGRKALTKAKGKQKEVNKGETMKGSHPRYPTQGSELERESYKMACQRETYEKSSQKLKMDDEQSYFNSKTADKTRSKKSKKHSGPEKECEGEIQINAPQKIKAVNEKEIFATSEMALHDSQHQNQVKGEKHKKLSEQRVQREVQIESESESSASSSEQGKVQGNNSDSTEEFNSEEDSAEEVSETEKYQKPSEQPREEEYPHSHRKKPVRKTKRKRGKSAKKYTQREANEEVNEPERYRKPSEKLQMDANEAVVKMTQRGTGPCHSALVDQSPDKLSKDDLKVVFKALHSVAKKYVSLGEEMNVKMNEIKKIQSQCSDPRGCLLEVLSVRLKQIPPLTWRDIDTALRSDTVGESQLADRIRRQYGHLYSSNLSFEASLDQEQGRKKSEMTKSKNKARKEKSLKKYTQQDSDEVVSESEKYRKPSKKVQMEVHEAVVKKTQQRVKKSPYAKRHSKPDKEYIEKELKHEGEIQRKKKATKYDKESQVVCGSQHRHKVKPSEQRAQEEVQIESESESSESSSEQEIIQINNSDSTEESYSSEEEEDSAEEVSETERYQKPSEQPREDEYPHSHRETPVRKTKGKSGTSSIILSKKKSKVYESGGKEKQKMKAVDQSVSNVESKNIIVGDACGKEKSIKSKMTKAICEIGRKRPRKQAPKEVQGENSATSDEEEPSSSSVYRKTREEEKASTRKLVVDKTELVLKKQYEVVIAKRKQPTTVQTDSENSASGSEEEQSHTPEPKRKIIPAVKYSNENTETISVKTPQETAGRPTELKADRKRKLSNKHQLTPKHVRLDHYSATSGEESPSNHSGTEMSIDKSPKTSAEQPNAEISDVEEEQHDTVRRKRVHSDSPPGSPPTSQGGTQSDSISKRRKPKRQRHHKSVKHRRKMKQESSSSSETDDDCSSPESDMLRNLTESENKGLIKVFKCCFGRLCLAIKDPDKAAVELQARRLLSCSMVESLLTSPESQQVKAIALVRALKKRIKSHPVKVFTIIEVFLRNEVLKETGRELWNETGT